MAEKREVTAREAKNNLEPFGYGGPARWTSIDAFVKANPRARAAVTADKGAFIQSEALGFSNGGMTQEEARAKLKQIGPTTSGDLGDYSDLSTFDNYNFSSSPFTLEEFKETARIAGAGGKTQEASDLNVIHGATYGYKHEDSDTESDDKPADTPADTPAPAQPVMSTPRQSAPAPDMPAAVSLEPSQEEIDRAAEIFSSDGTVTLPTGSYDLPSIETPTVEAPEGTTAVDAPTFQANIDRQAEQFKQRGIDQAQLIQPQTRAEKIAAGQAGKLEQRLYQNRQGMSTYVLGVYNSEGVWTPSQPIPQGYREANVGQSPYLVQQAANAPTTPNNVYQGGMIRGYDNGGMPQADDFPLPNEEDETSTPDTPKVTVADQPLTKEQVAQGQADLTAGAILDPAGTAVAAPVSQINPDAEGTVLGATTGQALTTAPIITDPAQVPKTITADTPDKPPVSKVTTQKAEDKIKTALEGGLDVQKMLDNVKGSSFYKPEYNSETGKITIEIPRMDKMPVPRIGEDGKPIPQEPLPPIKREVTPEEFLPIKAFVFAGLPTTRILALSFPYSPIALP